LIFEAETERLVGMGVVGPGARDSIVEGTLAIELGALAQDLALTIQPHPTLSETVAEAAEGFLGMATDIAPRRRRGEGAERRFR
jgi:dihydrolipoamide dehydrogenase